MENEETGVVVGEPVPGPSEPSNYKKFLLSLRHDAIYYVSKIGFLAALVTPAAGILVMMFLHHHRYYVHWLELVYMTMGLMVYAYLIPTIATKLSDHYIGKPEALNEKTGT
jgi:hypothetical protein